MNIGGKQASPGILTSRNVEEAAVEAARRGDLRAWEHVIRLHQELIFRTAYLATRDPEIADETTRGAFARAFRALPNLEHGMALRPWLMGIAASVARMRLREMTQRKDARLPDPDPSPRRAATPVALDAAIPRPTPLEHEALVIAFDSLADEDRLLIVSRHSFGLSRSEMAARLGIPPETVGHRLGAAIDSLRARLADAIGVAVDGTLTRATPLHAAHFASTQDYQLGAITAAAVVSELPWTPDVAPLVCSRLAREAVAYPEQFARDARETSVAAASATRDKGSSPRNGLESRKALRAAAGRPRRGVSMVFATTVVFVALVGMAYAADTPGWNARVEVGDRIGSLLEQAGLGIRSQKTAETLPSQDRLAADDVATPTNEGSSPMASRPTLAVIGGRPLKGGGIGARVVVAWAPDAGLGPVVSTSLERRTGNGPWRLVASAEAQERLDSVLHPGRRYSFRVHSYYANGNTTKSPSVGATLIVHDSNSDRLRWPREDWRTRARNAVGGSVLTSTTSKASINTVFTGSNVALVVPKGPASGAIRARVDGGSWSRSDLSEPARSARRVVLIQDLAKGRHSL
ncbi:MAG: sigma factor, partial [Chloroflexota bacterium]